MNYTLVNQTKKETVNFSHLPVGKKREIVGNPVSAAIVTWYLISNRGDDIQFVSDSDNEWPFKLGKIADYLKYHDKTEEIINILIEQGILKDVGIEYEDEDDPKKIYIRAIKNVWGKDDET